MIDTLEYTAGDPDLRPRADRPPVPDRMRHLSRDRRGFVVPWFVPWINDSPEFRAMDGSKLNIALKRDLCWLCGGTLGRHKIFVAGAMCVINRISPEPPCHEACADYAVRVCPFLTHPKMRRNETKLDAIREAGGRVHPEANPRNPGIVALYYTNGYRVLRDQGHTLLQLAAPARVGWFTQARTATRTEIIGALEAGKLVLAQQAFKDGVDLETIELKYRLALKLLPPPM